MSAPLLVGIAGGSGSGKTALARSLEDRFGQDAALIFHDNYYRRRDELTWNSAAGSTMTSPPRSRPPS